MDLLRPIECALAAEAAAHARATTELNPLSEAESVEIGNARAVYAGVFSPVNGVWALGLDGPVEERDLIEIERFFARKEAPVQFWTTSATDVSVMEHLANRYRAKKIEIIYGAKISENIELPAPQGTNTPEPQAWTEAFSRARGKTETDLFALTKLHQKETRFYQNGSASASYTFFHQGVAWAPFAGDRSLLALQWSDAKAFKASVFATYSPTLPKLYERTFHAPL